MTGGKKQPWMKFYPADWRAEPRLKMISRAARSLWIDLLGLMHEAGTGRLEVDGRPMTFDEIADVLGDSPRTIIKLMKEIEAAGVSSRDHENFVVSRRIIRDVLKAEKDKSNGAKGGNPSLKNNGLAEKGVNPEDKAQKPEARSQKPEARIVGDIGARPEAEAVETIPPVDYANDLATLETDLRRSAHWEREPAPMLSYVGEVATLIKTGCDPDLDVFPTVARLAPKVKHKTSWKYFLTAIVQARDDRLNAQRIASQPLTTLRSSHAKPNRAEQAREAADTVRQQLGIAPKGPRHAQ